MIQRKVGFVGAGVMAQALVTGMLRAKAAEASSLYASDPSEERRGRLSAMLGTNVLADNRQVARIVDVLVLSVKPNVVPVVAPEIAQELTPDHLVVSIAAGVTLGALRALLGMDRLIRVMPNTPALVGEGASAYCVAPGATADDQALVEQMLTSVGLCVRVEERHMDAVTGLSGSGPAYVYLVIEALTDGGVGMGLPRDVAVRLAASTVRGAGTMVLETGRPPAELRRQVTTPGGTTAEGLRVLDAAGVARAFEDAVAAAAEKSRRLADGR